MRVIAGKYRGRNLESPPNRAIRPTSDRTREALFNLLMHGEFAGQCITHQRVADICSGTGALGIEALSRGALHVTFLDQLPAALAITRRNLEKLGAVDQATLIEGDATRLPAAAAPYALVLADPPYDAPIIAAMFAALCARNWVEPGSIFACEIAAKTPTPVLKGAQLRSERSYGRAKILVWEIHA